MRFPPAVERWRSTVEKYVAPEYVDKFLWAMQGESRGNPGAIGDNGVAIGLMQVQSNQRFKDRPSAQWLADPENNIRYAAEALGAGHGNFKAWGDGTAGQPAYDPKTGKGRFGALGNNPFPGDTGQDMGGSSSMTQPTSADNLRSGQEARAAALEKLIDDAYKAEPPAVDANGDPTPEHTAWEKKVALLNQSLNMVYVALGRKDSSFGNDIASMGEAEKVAQLGQTRGAKEIDRFLSGLQESRGRAGLIAEAKKEQRMYGTAPGKSSFSYADLGAGFAAEAKRMGIDPNSPLVNYGGTVNLDPQGDMANYDSQFGVTGAIPGMPDIGLGLGDVPWQGSDVGAGLGDTGSGNDVGAGFIAGGEDNTWQPGEPWTPPMAMAPDLSQIQPTPGGPGQPPPWRPNLTPLERYRNRSPYQIFSSQRGF